MWQVRPGEEHEYEDVIVGDEGTFLLAAGEGGLVLLHPHQVHEVCDVCEEPSTTEDPLGHFKAPDRVGVYVLAHGQCGLDQELELA